MAYLLLTVALLPFTGLPKAADRSDFEGFVFGEALLSTTGTFMDASEASVLSAAVSSVLEEDLFSSLDVSVWS